MKKLTVIVLCALFAIHAKAQTDQINNNVVVNNEGTQNDNNNNDNSVPNMLIGFRFMPTISSFDVRKVDENTIETSSVVSYGFGGALGVIVSDHFAIQGEIIYSSLAQKYKDSRGENRVKLNYINVPLLLVLSTSYTAPVSLNLAFGPQIGFNTGSKFETGDAGNGTDTVNAVLAVKSSDIGIAYGAGIDFGFGENSTTKLSLGFRNVYGLVDVSDRSNNLETNDYYVLDKAHVKTYSAYIGLTFTF